jgi:adenosylmethionine-8-amino-7-oxononanoate aminotransferase
VFDRPPPRFLTGVCNPATVAGILIEPVGHIGGIITPTDEYFQIVRDICDRHEVMLIFDEIITGFGRTGNMFAAQTFGVTPDIICAGKGLSSGVVPLGAMAAREEMAQAFLGKEEEDVQFAHGNTFAGNPLACAAGIAVIEELVKDTKTNAPFPELGKALKKTSLKNGLILRVDPNWFAVGPALNVEESQLDAMMDLIEKSLEEALDLTVGQRTGSKAAVKLKG